MDAKKRGHLDLFPWFTSLKRTKSKFVINIIAFQFEVKVDDFLLFYNQYNIKKEENQVLYCKKLYIFTFSIKLILENKLRKKYETVVFSYTKSDVLIF